MSNLIELDNRLWRCESYTYSQLSNIQILTLSLAGGDYGDWPKNLSSLTVYSIDSFDNIVDILNLPENVKELTFDGRINIEAAPPSLIKFESHRYVDNLFDILPKTLQHLSYYGDYGEHEDNIIASFTELITLSIIFGDETTIVTNLPEGLKQFTIYGKLSPIINRLPSTLTHLTLDYCDEDLLPVIPPSLIYLSISGMYLFNDERVLSLNLENINVEYLTILSRHRVFSIQLPNSLKKLTASYDVWSACVQVPDEVEVYFPYTYMTDIMSKIPLNIKHIRITTSKNKHLIYHSNSLDTVEISYGITYTVHEISHLPPNIKNLHCAISGGGELIIPSTLVNLILHNIGDIVEIKKVPRGVKSILLYGKFIITNPELASSGIIVEY
jgi:hypothetical protein